MAPDRRLEHVELLWPAVTWEELAWESNVPPGLLSRSAAQQMREPYRASIAATIADLELRLPRSTAAAAEEAAALIRDFDNEVGREVAPFAAILLRSESASSSQIENITSGAKQIGLAEIGEDARADAAMIVGNVEAMRAAIALSQTMDADSILAMHRALLVRAAPDVAGRWRTEQVWIGGGGYSPHNASFVPPQADRVPGAPLRIWSRLPTVTTSLPFSTPRSPTRSSRPSTHSSTATVAPAAHLSTPCSAGGL